MKLHRVEIEGFGPFRARQIVDFDAFADEGLFLIAGRTGAGKSSILDAICFALYGTVPRYSDSVRKLRSDHAATGEATEVVLEFSTNEGRWRITRSPEYERPKTRGEGTTLQAATVQLDRLEQSGWTGIASRERVVAEELQNIVQLSKEQFLQTILLAQNRFARFLLAKNDERKKLLQTLFGTRRFEDYERLLDERRKELVASTERGELRLQDLADHAERELVTLRQLIVAPPSDEESNASEDLHTGAEPSEETEKPRSIARRLENIALAVDEFSQHSLAAEEAHTTLASGLATAEQRRDAAVALRAEQQRRDAAREKLNALGAEQDEIARAVTERDRARRAAELREVLQAVDRAVAIHEQMQAEEDQARRVMAERHEPEPERGTHETSEVLESIIAEQSQLLVRLEDARALELAAESRRTEREKIEQEDAAAGAALRTLEDEERHAPEQIAGLRAAIEELTPHLAAEESRQEELRRARAIAKAAEEAEKLGEKIAVEERAVAEASLAVEAAWATFNVVNLARLDGAAAVLAAELKDDHECPVCGSREHPRPARSDHPLVTDEQLAHAEEERERAMSAHSVAVEALSATQREHAGVRERAEGHTRAEAGTLVTAAEAALDESLRARRTQEGHREELRARETRGEALSQELRAAREQSVSSARALAAALEQDRLIGARIAEARGDYPSVESRIAEAELLRSDATKLARALVERQRSAEALRNAQERREEAVGASLFTATEEVLRALRSEDEVAELDRRINAHEAELISARRALEEAAEKSLPDEPVDTVALEVTVAELRERVVEQARCVDSLRSGTARVRTLKDHIATEHSALAAVIADKDAAERLANTISGRAPNTKRMSLESYVLAAELEDIVDAANLKLSEMSDGRYRLVHSDALARYGGASGLGIDVYDAYTGASRPAQSLSGGETFLASLALALGLADVVTGRAGGIRLDTLFVDEGFGSLDVETLEVAMRVLDGLRQGGRTVGVISHVEAMQDQIVARITVERGLNGPSVIHQGG